MLFASGRYRSLLVCGNDTPSSRRHGRIKQFRPRWHGPRCFPINEDLQSKGKVVILLNPDAQPGIDGVLADRAGNAYVHQPFDQAFKLAKIRG